MNNMIKIGSFEFDIRRYELTLILPFDLFAMHLYRDQHGWDGVWGGRWIGKGRF